MEGYNGWLGWIDTCLTAAGLVNLVYLTKVIQPCSPRLLDPSGRTCFAGGWEKACAYVCVVYLVRHDRLVSWHGGARYGWLLAWVVC